MTNSSTSAYLGGTDINLMEEPEVLPRDAQFLDGEPGTRAVLYLRVSSTGQVNTDYDPEGISLPAQRRSCLKKAEQMGFTVIDEYVEPGRSGTEMTKRIAFQQMLERIRRTKDIDHVIVYELSRMARNRIDDAIVMADLRKRGVTLVSATENIDATPVGQLMHGLLAAFNEYRSAKDGVDIAYKMGEKAKNGGTLGKATVGYLNIIDRSEGREIRTVAIDPERAPYIKLAFELYASGDWAAEDIADELAERGLTMKATLKHPTRPLSSQSLFRLLKDRYYLGNVIYKGEEYPGRHEPLIDEATFNKVQEIFDTRGVAGERRRIHHHYLKGTLFCGKCYAEGRPPRRMIVQRAIGRNKAEYFYFFCRGIQDNICDARFSNMQRIEEAVTDHYKTIQLKPDFIASMRSAVDETLADTERSQRLLKKQLDAKLKKLAVQEENLLDLAADGQLPQAKIRDRIRDIERQRDRIQAQRESCAGELEQGAAFIKVCLKLLENPYELYLNASDEVRRRLNQAIFKHIYVHNDEVTGHEFQPGIVDLFASQEATRAPLSAAKTSTSPISAETEQAAPKGDLSSMVQPTELIHLELCFSKPHMVELRGIEPRSSNAESGLLRVQSARRFSQPRCSHRHVVDRLSRVNVPTWPHDVAR